MSNSTASRRMSSIDYIGLSTHVDACLHELVDRGYAKRTIDLYRRGLDHFSHWVTRHRTPWNREEELVRRFLSSHLHVCDCLTLSAALHHLLRFLRARGTSSRATMVRAGSKRKYNALTPILSGSAASPLRPARCERISSVDSYARVFRAALSTSATVTPSKFAGLLRTLCKDGGGVP